MDVVTTNNLFFVDGSNPPVCHLDFELEEKTPEGTPKVFSVGSRSSTAAQLVLKLKEGKSLGFGSVR